MCNVNVNADGSITGRIEDPYNYEKWNLKHYKDMDSIKDTWKTFKHNLVTRINNRAYEQQQNNQLESLFISMPFNLTEEEIRKLKKKYGRL
jgi:enoyl reductase-like protein